MPVKPKPRKLMYFESDSMPLPNSLMFVDRSSKCTYVPKNFEKYEHNRLHRFPFHYCRDVWVTSDQNYAMLSGLWYPIKYVDWNKNVKSSV